METGMFWMFITQKQMVVKQIFQIQLQAPWSRFTNSIVSFTDNLSFCLYHDFHTSQSCFISFVSLDSALLSLKMIAYYACLLELQVTFFHTWNGCSSTLFHLRCFSMILCFPFMLNLFFLRFGNLIVKLRRTRIHWRHCKILTANSESNSLSKHI